MISGTLLAAMLLAPSALANDAPDALDVILREPLLAYSETRAELEAYVLERIPALTLAEDAEAWRAQSKTLRQRMLDEVIYKGVPAAWIEGEPAVEWGETLEPGDGYRIRKLRYEALPGLWIPALLYEPTRIEGKVPAVFNVNGHEYPLGKAIPYEQRRCINLAKRGMLALHPEWLRCGELNEGRYDHNRLAYLDVCGVSGVSVFYQAMKRGLDVLLAHPSADPERVAMTGLSGGGWQTIILSSLDTRIRLTAPNAGYMGLAPRVTNLSSMGDLEQSPTDQISVADYTHLTAMLVPRPVQLIYNAKDDCCFTAFRARMSVYEPVIAFYEQAGRPDAFAFHENFEPGTHNYDADNRIQFYHFLNEHMDTGPDPTDEDLECEDEILSMEELACGVPEDNADWGALADAIMADLPQNPAPQDETAREAWRADAKTRLREVLRFKPLAVQEAEKVAESNGYGLRTASYRLALGEWTIPAVVVEPSEGTPTKTVVVAADRGKGSRAWDASGMAGQNVRVVLVDLLFSGECRNLREREHQYAMMIATVGERPLGIQTGQLLAAADWAREQFGEPMELLGAGQNAGVAALAAGVLSGQPLQAVEARDGRASLKSLITGRASYEDAPPLFCFGLLREFDIPDLAAACAPAEVKLSSE